MPLIFLFPATFLAVAGFSLFKYHQLRSARQWRVFKVIHNRMWKRGESWDYFEFGRRLGTGSGDARRLACGESRIDAANAARLVGAFPDTTMEYWRHLDKL